MVVFITKQFEFYSAAARNGEPAVFYTVYTMENGGHTIPYTASQDVGSRLEKHVGRLCKEAIEHSRSFLVPCLAVREPAQLLNTVPWLLQHEPERIQLPATSCTGVFPLESSCPGRTPPPTQTAPPKVVRHHCRQVSREAGTRSKNPTKRCAREPNRHPNSL